MITLLTIDRGVWIDTNVPTFELAEQVPSAAQGDEASPREAIYTEHVVRPDAAAKQAPLITASAECGAKKNQALNGFVVAYGDRGIDGELSEREVDIFTSDAVWNQPDPWIVLKPRRSRAG